MSSSLPEQVSAARLMAHLRALEGERHPSFSPQRLKQAHEYVCDQWRTMGFKVFSHECPYLGERFHNATAHPAHFPSGPRIIIGAHLDTVPGTPGADDNASGLAALLEVSRIVANAAFSRPVEFVAFTLEELGMVGSSHYAESLKRAKTEILGMISLEMVGFTESEGLQHYPLFLRGRFPPIGDYIGLASNRRSRKLLDSVAAAMQSVPGLPVQTLILPGNGWVFPEARLSDHSPFWDRGYPALMVTDTSFFRNPHYHKASDLIQTLDLDFLKRVTQGLVACVRRLAAVKA